MSENGENNVGTLSLSTSTDPTETMIDNNEETNGTLKTITEIDNNDKLRKAKLIIKKFMDEHGGFAEAYSVGTEFSLLNNNNEAIHSFTYCKDFISDIYWGDYFNKATNIYSFHYSPNKKNKPSMSPAKMLVRNKKIKNVFHRAKSCEAFFHYFERDFGMSNGFTRCVGIPEYECVYIESPSDDWVDNLPMISLWTLVGRVGFSSFNHTKESKESTLAEVLQNLIDKKNGKAIRDSARINVILGFLPRLVNGEFRKTLEKFNMESFKNSPIHHVHNNSGIISTINMIRSKER